MSVQCAKCGKPLTAAQLTPGPQGVQCAYCGATVPIFDQSTLVTQGQAVPSAASVELQIDGYQILGRLGEGGMGIVYLALQVSLDRKVAIKVLSPTLLRDPGFLARFDREIAALVRLSHPNIVTIFDRGQSAAGQVYYVMEHVEGEGGGAPLDLERLITDRRLDSQRTRDLMLQIVQALGFAHREGIIHRDVKPTNILIDRHGFAKVADFGIACMRGDHAARPVTVANACVGTAIYASPEQQRDAASVDHRSDIYGAGVMLYQMLTGHLPLAGYAPPSITVPGLSRQWDAIVARAIQPRPEERFADMAEFEHALRDLGSTVVAQPIPTPAASPVPAHSTGAGPLVCPQCGGGAAEADQFCVGCGISLWTTCRQCGYRVFATANFCPGCRADVQNQRVFEDYLQLGKEYLEPARQGPNSADRLRQLEQARLALEKALSCIEDTEARSLADETRQLILYVAWQAGELAAQAKRLAEASYCYGQMLEAQPGHALATACLEKLHSYRHDLISKAQRLFAEGQQSKAVALLRTGVEQFPDDDELIGLLTQYHENSVQLRELRDRIPALAEHNRWCEVMQIVAELRQSGIPIKGLDEQATRAQQRLAAVEPLIAAANVAMDQRDYAQAQAQAEAILQQVADHAEAMGIAGLARSRAVGGRRRRRVVITTAALAGLAMCGTVAYLYAMEALRVREAKQQIQRGHYAAAVQTLNGLPHRYFCDRTATYLQNVARVKEYATSAENAPQDGLLGTAKTQLQSLFERSEGWRARAQTDLRDAIDRVPDDLGRPLDRSLPLAQTLRDLKLAEPDALAAALLTRARKGGRVSGLAFRPNDAACVQQILAWNPKALEEIVILTLPEKRSVETGLHTLQAWAVQGVVPARDVAAAILPLADAQVEFGYFSEAKLMIDTVKQLDPQRTAASFWEKHLQRKLERKDPRGAVGLLTQMVRDERDARELSRAVRLYQNIKTQFPRETPAPPPELGGGLRRTDFDTLIAAAEQAVAKRQDAEALKLLMDAWKLYPDLYQGSGKPQTLYAQANFRDALSRAQRFLAEGNLAAAEKAVDEALKLRPNDADAKQLQAQLRRRAAEQVVLDGRRLLDAKDWDKAAEFLQNPLFGVPGDANLLAMLDEARAHQHGVAAKQAHSGDPSRAIEEIVAARRLLQKHATEAWSVTLRQELDGLAEKVTERLCTEAQKLADQRQYAEAQQKLDLALPLTPIDPKLEKLRGDLEKLSAGAKTANLSGRWKAPAGLLTANGQQLLPTGAEFEFVDRGSEITVKAVELPALVREFSGTWRRTGTRLEGTFQLVLRPQTRSRFSNSDGNETSVRAKGSANIKKDSTLAVEWKLIRIADLRTKEFKLDGFVDWTKAD